MKAILSLLAAIAVCVSLCFVYAGWTGHGLVVIDTGFLFFGLMAAMLLAILVYCCFQCIRKGLRAWRQWLLRTATLLLGWVVVMYAILVGGHFVLIASGHAYWRWHRVEMESVALKQLELRRVDGVFLVPTNEVPRFDYPVFVQVDSSNGVQLVGFSQWSTSPGRRGGFLFVKAPNDLELGAIKKDAEWVRQLNTNWFEYYFYWPAGATNSL